MSINCVYCEKNPSGNSEHVFPKSLGGESIYMDCVCDKCNNDFSKIERELFQKSLIGLMRSYEGVEGYSKNKKRPAPLKFPEMFQFDKENKIVCEVGIHKGFVAYLRPQLIQIGNEIYAEAPSVEEVQEFIDAFNNWRNRNLVMVTKFPLNKGEKYTAVKFILSDGKFRSEDLEIDKVKKEVIHYNLMKDNDEYKDYFEPRLFFDDSKKRVVRSRSVKEGIKFITKLLNYCNQEAANFKSFSEKNVNDPVRASMKFNINKMNQAIVKIGLNCLMHYYPETKSNSLLRPIKDNVISGTEIKTSIDKKINLLDTRQDMHSIFFYQLDEGLMIRTSLFGGHYIYSFLIEKLNLFERKGHFSGLEIDFKNSKQKHFNMEEYLLNRVSDLGFLENLNNPHK